MSAFLKLELPWPPSDNEYFKPYAGRRGIGPSEKVIAYKSYVSARYGGSTMVLYGPVWVSGRLFPAREGCDFFNRNKALWDSLIGIAYLDDRQIQGVMPGGEGYCWGPTSHENPRVELTLVGERWATIEEIEGSRMDKLYAKEKARVTRNRNRAEKLANKLRRGVVSAYSPPLPSSGGGSILLPNGRTR